MTKRIVIAAIGVTAILGLAAGLASFGCSSSGHCHGHDMQAAGQPAVIAAKPAAIANSQCPIMGGAVNPSLTREYKGQTVAFCCGMCPPAWDKLSDSQKDAKLAAVVTPAK